MSRTIRLAQPPAARAPERARSNREAVNILLVDDEPANLLALEAILGQLGENLVRATSGEEALRQILRMDFAAILLDVRMPSMSGFETARLIRSRPASRRTPILFVTAAPDDINFPLEEAYDLGAVDYLTKPLVPTVLRAKVAFFVDLYRKTEELARAERARHAAALNAKNDRIRLILDNVRGYAFVVTDTIGRVTEWEGGAETITGWRRDEVVGQSGAAIFTPDDRAAGIFESELAKAEETGRAEDRRWLLRKDGTRFFADGVTVALNDNGRLRGFAKIFRDATDEQQARERLRASEEKFSLLLESAGEGIFGLAPDCTCTFLNAAGAAMLDLRANELIGRTIHEVIQHHRGDGTAYPASESRINQAVRNGFALRVEDDVFWRKDGTPVSVSYSVSPMVLGGRAMGAVITFTDTTKRKRDEDDLRRLAEALAEGDRRKTEFLATLAHELRNPLVPIQNGLEIMRLAANPATIAKTRESMVRQLAHLVHLVDDLLDVARITRGTVKIRRERAELKNLVANAIETVVPLIKGANHRLTVELPDEPMAVNADPTRIVQVISNLLNNAAKYTPPGGAITLSVRRDGDTGVITVSDNGVGIAQEALELVFQMFTRVRPNISQAQGGLGIGLALVRQLVELHGGQVSASSVGPGKGSTFTVRLPLAENSRQEQSALAVDLEEEAATRSLRILVVDDNTEAAESLSALLEIGGHTVRSANDGRQALALCREFKPEVAFLDIGMPGMDGYQVAQALREMPDLKPLTLIALTGWGDERDRARSREAGFDEHITKPADPTLLKNLLSRLAPQTPPRS